MDKGKTIAVGSIIGGISALIIATTRARAEPEDIVISDLSIFPQVVYVGDPVEITVIVTNIGEQPADYQVRCEVY